MSFPLKPDQQAWLRAHVANGDFASDTDALRSLFGASLDEWIADRISQRMADYELGLDDLTWAKPAVDEARAAVARGDLITLDEHRARNAKRFATLAK